MCMLHALDKRNSAALYKGGKWRFSWYIECNVSKSWTTKHAIVVKQYADLPVTILSGWLNRWINWTLLTNLGGFAIIIVYTRRDKKSSPPMGDSQAWNIAVQHLSINNILSAGRRFALMRKSSEPQIHNRRKNFTPELLLQLINTKQNKEFWPLVVLFSSDLSYTSPSYLYELLS